MMMLRTKWVLEACAVALVVGVLESWAEELDLTLGEDPLELDDGEIVTHSSECAAGQYNAGIKGHKVKCIGQIVFPPHADSPHACSRLPENGSIRWKGAQADVVCDLYL